jgi:hypothetical protein
VLQLHAQRETGSPRDESGQLRHALSRTTRRLPPLLSTYLDPTTAADSLRNPNGALAAITGSWRDSCSSALVTTLGRTVIPIPVPSPEVSRSKDAMDVVFSRPDESRKERGEQSNDRSPRSRESFIWR